MQYVPESKGVKALVESGKLNPRKHKLLKIIDYLTIHSENKYTQAELRKYADVCIKTCSCGLNALLELNLVIEVKSMSNRHGWVKAYMTNIDSSGNLINNPDLNAKLNT
jgi:hypothetical protein